MDHHATMRAAVVHGTRRDLAEAIAFAARNKVRAHVQARPLADINAVFAELKAGAVSGRVVLQLH